jgi:hypothetical protein
MTFLRAAYHLVEPILGTAFLLSMAGYLAVSCLVAWGVARLVKSGGA